MKVFWLCLLMSVLYSVSVWSQGLAGSQVDIEKQGEANVIVRPGRDAAELFINTGDLAGIPSGPGDEALGEQRVLKRKREYTPFTIFGDTGWNWTNNVALTRDYTQEDSYLLSTTGISYQPVIRNDLLGEITFTHQWFSYDRYAEMNFESMNIGAGVSYALPKLTGTIFFCRYNYNRLTNADARSEFLRNHSITAGIFKIYPLARNHYLYASYSSQIGFSDPTLYERDYYSVIGGYNLTVVPGLSFDLSLRASYIPYTMNGREDYNESLSLTISYKPKPWIQINLSSFAAFNQSNQSSLQYNVINAAPNLAMKIKF